MADYHVKTNREITLHLDEEEAFWLKNALQNPVSVENPEDEDDYEIRKEIFEVLKIALQK